MTAPEPDDLRRRAERWDRLAILFERASAMNADERTAFVRLECRDDPGLREELERLLGSKAPAASFHTGARRAGVVVPALHKRQVNRKVKQ